MFWWHLRDLRVLRKIELRTLEVAVAYTTTG